MLKLFFVFVLLLALTQGQTQSDITKVLDTLPKNVRTVIERSKQLEQIIALYQTAVASEVASLSGNVVTTLQSLAANAASKVATLTASLASLQTEATATLTELTTKIAESLGKTQGLSTLVSQFGDVRAALQIECEDLKNASAIAISAVKEIAVGKIQALIAEQNLYLSANYVQLATDEAARNAFIQQVIALRATAKVADQLPPIIQAFIANNSAAIEKCVSAVQEKTAALALGVKNAYDEVKEIIVSDVQQFKDRLTNIAQHVLADKSATIQQIAHVVDEVKKQINVTISVDVALASDDFIEQTIKAVLEGLTLGKAEVTKVLGGKRGLLETFTAYISGGSSALGTVSSSTDLQVALQNLQNDPAVQAQLTTMTGLSSEQITALLSTALAELQTAQKASQDAVTLWQQKVTEFLTKAASAKQAIKSAVSSEKDKLVAVFQAQQAFLEAKEKEVASQLNDLKARIPELTVELQNIQKEVLSVAAQLSSSGLTADAITLLKAKNSSLIEAAKAKIVELLAAKQQLDAALKTKYAQTVQEIAALKAEFAAKLQLAVQAQLNATAAEIQKRIAEKSAEIKQRLSDIIRAIQSDVSNISTVVQNIPEGTKLIQSVVFDNAKVAIEDVVATLKSVIQAEFGTPKVTVTVKAGTKRSAQTATVESTVASADGSSSTPAPNGLPAGALIGIIVGAVVVVVVIVAIVALTLKKKNDDDYQSMRA